MKVVPLPSIDTDGPANIPEKLRQLANDIESGKYTPKTIIIVQDLEDGIDSQCIGYRPRYSATMGLLEYAKCMFYERAGK